MVTAQEIACWAYCPEQWRLQYRLGLEPANRATMEAGTRHHARKAAAERVAGGSLAIGRLLVAAALLVLLLLWVLFPMMATPWVAAVAVLALLLGLVLVLTGRGLRRRRGLGEGRTVSLDWVTLTSRRYGRPDRPARQRNAIPFSRQFPLDVSPYSSIAEARFSV